MTSEVSFPEGNRPVDDRFKCGVHRESLLYRVSSAEPPRYDLRIALRHSLLERSPIQTGRCNQEVVGSLIPGERRNGIQIEVCQFDPPARFQVRRQKVVSF